MKFEAVYNNVYLQNQFEKVVSKLAAICLRLNVLSKLILNHVINERGLLKITPGPPFTNFKPSMNK